MSLSIANLGAAGALLLVWLFLSGRHNQQGEKGLRRPPTLPSVIPFIGHLPEFLWDGGKLLRKAASFSGTAVPVRIRLPGFSSFVVSGPEAIQAFFKNTRDLSTTSRSITIMQNAFGCPPHLLDHFRPRPSVDGVQDEVEQAIHRGVQTGLAGAQLSVLADRFQTTLLEKLDTSRCTPGDDGWTDIPDLCEFVQKPVVESVISVFFGPYMISLNPGIVDDFWRWNKDVRLMFMGMPRWWIPGAYRLREKMIQNIIRWQKHARENYKGLGLGEDEWEPFYGSKFIRERQDLLTSRGIMDETARASENLANMWAANSNAVPAAMWFLIEILRDPVLKKEASDCISSALLPAASPAQMQNRVRAMFDAPKLCADPLLQSVYAETLRLRVAALIVREAAHGDFSFGGWWVRKNEVLTVSSQTEAMSAEVWSAGPAAAPRPLDTFWARRFLVDPGNPASGPLCTLRATRPAPPGPRFSLDGLAASWIPYGGGKSLCPGRHFAKREMVLTTAVFLALFDIELAGQPRADSDMHHFGFGTMPPNSKIPCRIRRRSKA